jgi:hypothetical protein
VPYDLPRALTLAFGRLTAPSSVTTASLFLESAVHRIVLAASVAVSLTIGLAPDPAVAADFAAFRTACANGGPFLLGEVPEGKNAQPVIAAICPCLEAGFASYSQAEIDALEADLRTGTSDEAKAKYPAYQELQAKATGVLNTCFTSEAVVSAARAEGL